MPPKVNIKELLKTARDSATAEQWEECATACKTILRSDKDQYLAWVLLGLSSFKLKIYDQAIQSYKKATILKEDQPTAWQGLIEVLSREVDEFNEDETQLLRTSLIKLLKEGVLNSTHNKYQEYQKQFVLVLQQLKLKEEAINELELMINSPIKNDQVLHWCWKTLIQLHKELEGAQNNNNILSSKVNEVYKRATRDNRNVFGEEFIPSYLQRIMNSKDYSKNDLIMEFEELIKIHPTSYEPIEYLIQSFDEDENNNNNNNNNNNIQDKSSLIRKISKRKAYLNLLHYFPDRALASVCFGILLFEENGNNLKVISKIINLITNNLKISPLGEGYYYLARCHFQLKQYRKTQEIINVGLMHVKKQMASPFFAVMNRLQNELLILMAKSYFQLEKLREAEQIYLRVLEKCKDFNRDCVFGIALIEIENGKLSSAEKRLCEILEWNSNDHQTYSSLGKIKILEKEWKLAEEYLLKAIKIDNNIGEYHFLLGKIYWKLGGNFREDKKFTQQQLLLAAKLNPLLSSPFAFLGLYYQFVENDLEKAKRCYQKSLSLNSEEKEAGKKLSEIYVKESKMSLAVSIYKDATKSNQKQGIWAFLRLGKYFLTDKGYEEAINAYQNVIRFLPDYYEAWEGLGIAYKELGKYMASVKAFQKALEINSISFISRFYLGSVYQLIGMNNEALLEFHLSLENSSPLLSPYFNIGEVHFNEAQVLYNECLYEKSALALRDALSSLFKFSVFAYHLNGYNDKDYTSYDKKIELLGQITPNNNNNNNNINNENNNKNIDNNIDNDLNSKKMKLLKLLGDIHTFTYYIPDSYIEFIFAQSKLKLLEFGMICYFNALQFNSSISLLQYDAGVNNYYQYQLLHNNYNYNYNKENNKENNNKKDDNNNNNQQNNFQLKNQKLNDARKYFKEAIKLDKTNSLFWNALGISEIDPNVRQHYFILSIQLEQNNVEAWFNLGNLYLQFKQFSLANDCFVHAQTLDPEFEYPWIGTAILNELKEDKISVEIAKNQFQHAHDLNQKSRIAKMSLSHLSILKNKDWNESMVLLSKCIEQQPKCHLTWNLLGISQEKQKLFKSSIYSYNQSLELLNSLQNNNKNNNNNEGENNNNNKLELFSHSILQSSDDNLPIDILIQKVKLNLARIYVKSKEYKKAFDIYNSFDLNNDLEKRDHHWPFVAITLFHLSHFDRCETLLLSIAETGNQEGALSLCRFYFHRSQFDKMDKTLSSWLQKSENKKLNFLRLSANLSIAIGKFEIAEKNLKEIFSNFNPSIEDFELKIYFFIQLKEIQKAKRNYLQAIHLFPSNRILRISFLKFLKYYFPKDSSQFSIFIENLPNYSLPSSSSYYSSHLLDLSPLPNKWEEQKLLSEVYLMLGKTSSSKTEQILIQSKTNLKKSLHLNPTNISSHYLLAIISYAQAIIYNDHSSYSSALFSLQSVQKLISKFPENNSEISSKFLLSFHWMEIDCLIQLKEFKNALENLQKFTSEFESKKKFSALEKAAAETQLAKCYLALKDERALPLLLQTSSSNPSFFPAFEVLGQYYAKEKNIEGSKIAFESIIKNENISENNRLSAAAQLSTIYYQNQDFKNGLRVIDEFLSSTSLRSACGFFIKSILHISSNELKTAVKSLQRCLILDPIMPLANYLLAQIHLKVRDYGAAESDLLFEIDNNPLFDLPYLALAYFAYNEAKSNVDAKETAMKYLQKGTELKPDRKAYSELKDKLNEIK